MILVTGGAGYIGSVTAELLLERGERVVILDNLDRGHRHAIPDGAIFYEGNVGDRQLTSRIAHENEIEACIHFAALAYVGTRTTLTEPKHRIVAARGPYADPAMTLFRRATITPTKEELIASWVPTQPWIPRRRSATCKSERQGGRPVVANPQIAEIGLHDA